MAELMLASFRIKATVFVNCLSTMACLWHHLSVHV
jgi:hypothetical protein